MRISDVSSDVCSSDLGRDRYVDAEAVRVKRLNGRTGIAERRKEVWKRYAIPLAITEVHLGCTREEQVRWLLEVWQAAKSVRQDGVDLRAVTLDRKSTRLNSSH